MSLKEEKIQERIEALNFVRGLTDEDNRIYVSQVHVSRSGMQRRLRLYWMDTTQEYPKVDITYHASKILGWSMDNRGLKVDGCGMDMHFHTVYTLSGYLYPDGFKVEGVGRNGDTSGWDDNGGYYLKCISL